MNSISFGDGKIRKRHHVRNKDTIKIGEISQNEDLQLDVEVPVNMRYKKFSSSNIKKSQQFQLDLSKKSVDVEKEIEKLHSQRKSGRVAEAEDEVKIESPPPVKKPVKSHQNSPKITNRNSYCDMF